MPRRRDRAELGERIIVVGATTTSSSTATATSASSSSSSSKVTVVFARHGHALRSLILLRVVEAEASLGLGVHATRRNLCRLPRVHFGIGSQRSLAGCCQCTIRGA
jgi:hypothetical protein